jgi:LacI family transcriptional regulator
MKPIKPATMRDVAKLAGVSQPTVSRVLNQKESNIAISDETVTKVMAAIKELNYRPNVLAQSLRTQETKMIALLLADITNSFYHPIARAIHNVAREHQFDVLIADSDHVYENEVHFCEAVTRRPVDGVIMVPIHLSNAEIDNFITRTNTPVVVLGQHINHPNVDVVFVDDETAIYKAISWLIHEKGHRELGYVGVPHDLPPSIRRARGFRRAIADANLELNPAYLVEGDFTMEGGRRATQELISRGTLPTAIMVANDLMAISVILTLQEAGYRVPEDVAVIGFDNIPEAQIVRPSLTTIVHNAVDIGHKLAKALFERIENPHLPPRRFESGYELAIREST